MGHCTVLVLSDDRRPGNAVGWRDLEDIVIQAAPHSDTGEHVDYARPESYHDDRSPVPGSTNVLAARFAARAAETFISVRWFPLFVVVPAWGGDAQFCDAEDRPWRVETPDELEDVAALLRQFPDHWVHVLDAHV